LQHQRLGRREQDDDPAAVAPAVPVDQIPDLEVLPPVDDPVGTVDVQADQVLEPVVTVEAGAVGADLF